MSTTSGTEKQPLTQNQSHPTSPEEQHGDTTPCFLRHITAISRMIGVAVLAVLWAATVTSLKGKVDGPRYIRYYLLGASILITFFEITWILDKMACCVREGCCCKVWSVILWVDGWRKFILYTAASVPLFLQGIDGIIDVISGFCLLALGCLYLMKSFTKIRRRGGDGHVPVPDSKQQPTPSSIQVVCHEMSTQTDFASPSPSPAPPPAPSPSGRSETQVSSITEQTQPGKNPFDTEEDDDNADAAE